MPDWINTLKGLADEAVARDPQNILWVWGLGLGTLLALIGLGLLLYRLGRRSVQHYQAIRSGGSAGQDEEDKIDPLTLVVAAGAFIMAGNGMWNFFGDTLGLEGSPLRALFLVLEALALACARRVRARIRKGEPAGIDWWIMWGIAVLSGVMSASDDSGWGSAFRFAMPIVAGIAWELALSGSRNLARERFGERLRERSRAALTLTPKRLLIRLGLMDASGRSLDDVARERIISRAALMSDRYLTLMSAASGQALSWWRSRALIRARSRAHRHVRKAMEQAGLGTDPKWTNLFMRKMAVLRQFDALRSVEFEAPWKIVDIQEPQVEKVVEPPKPLDSQPKRRQNNKITPAPGRKSVPDEALNYWVSVIATTDKQPTTQQLRDECGAGSAATARRWRSLLEKQDVSALVSAARQRSPQALTSVNGSNP